jgi:hypothetical protein
MNIEFEISKFIKKVISTTNLDDLKDLVDQINLFLKENNVKETSDEFKRLNRTIHLMKMKLRHERRFHAESVESKSYLISEEQLTIILNNLTN